MISYLSFSDASEVLLFRGVTQEVNVDDIRLLVQPFGKVEKVEPKCGGQGMPCICAGTMWPMKM